MFAVIDETGKWLIKWIVLLTVFGAGCGLGTWVSRVGDRPFRTMLAGASLSGKFCFNVEESKKIDGYYCIIKQHPVQNSEVDK